MVIIRIFVESKNLKVMNKIIFSAILMLLFPMAAMGQYANYQNKDVTSTKEYKVAQATFYSGLAVTGVGGCRLDRR